MTLAHSRYADLFENGYDQLLKNGYWRLKHVSRETIEQLSANVSSSGRGSPHSAVLAASGSSLTASGSHTASGSLGSPVATPLHHLSSSHHHHASHHHHHHHLTPGTPSPLTAHAAHGHPALHIASGFTSAAASPSSGVAAPAHILNLKYGSGSPSALGGHPMNFNAFSALAAASGLSSTAVRPATHGEEQMSILASLAMAEGAEELNTVNSLTALSASSQSIGGSSSASKHMSMADELDDYSSQHAADRRRAMSAQFRSSPSANADVHSPMGDGSMHQMRKEYQLLESKYKSLENDHRTALLQLEKYHSLLVATVRQDESTRITFARQAEMQDGQMRQLIEKVQILERELNQRSGNQVPGILNSLSSPPKPSLSNVNTSSAVNSILSMSNSSVPPPSGVSSPSGTATPTPMTSASMLQSASQAASGPGNASSNIHIASAAATASNNNNNNNNTMISATNMQSLLQANAAAQASLAAAFSSGAGINGATASPQAMALLQSHPMGAAAAAALFGVSAANMQKMGAGNPAGFPAAAAMYPRTALPWLAGANGLNPLNPLGWVGISAADQMSALTSQANAAGAKIDLTPLQQIAVSQAQSQAFGNMLAAAAAQQASAAAAPLPTAASPALVVTPKATSPVNTNMSVPAPTTPSAEMKTDLTASGGAPSPSPSSVSTVTTPNSVKAELADSTASAHSAGSSSTSSGMAPQPLVA